jgi:hypothetical protein
VDGVTNRFRRLSQNRAGGSAPPALVTQKATRSS